MSLDEVFGSGFLRRLEALTLRASKHFRSLGRGDRRSRRRGASPEFAEHRHYYAGDDIRRIDWLAYARLGELLLKEHAAEQDLMVHLLLDCSASMGRAFQQAQRLAAALVYVALAGGDRARLQIFANGEMGARLGPGRGKRLFPKVLEFLSSLEASGKTGLDEATRRFCTAKPTQGLVLLVSDFADPLACEAALKRLDYSGYEVLAVQVLAAEELDPEARGELEFECPETGERIPVSLDRSSLRLYRERLQGWLSEIEGFCKKRGIGYLRARDDQGLEELLCQRGREAQFFQ